MSVVRMTILRSPQAWVLSGLDSWELGFEMAELWLVEETDMVMGTVSTAMGTLVTGAGHTSLKGAGGFKGGWGIQTVVALPIPKSCLVSFSISRMGTLCRYPGNISRS